MSEQEDTREMTQAAAAGFAASLRGQLIISQALYHGIKALESIVPPYREDSNIEDMKYLFNELFPLYATVEEATRVVTEAMNSSDDDEEQAQQEGMAHGVDAYNSAMGCEVTSEDPDNMPT